MQRTSNRKPEYECDGLSKTLDIYTAFACVSTSTISKPHTGRQPSKFGLGRCHDAIKISYTTSRDCT